MAVKEALMQGGKESDYLLFVDNKAIGVVEAKKESDSLGPKVPHRLNTMQKLRRIGMVFGFRD